MYDWQEIGIIQEICTCKYEAIRFQQNLLVCETSVANAKQHLNQFSFYRANIIFYISGLLFIEMGAVDVFLS